MFFVQSTMLSVIRIINDSLNELLLDINTKEIVAIYRTRKGYKYKI